MIGLIGLGAFAVLAAAAFLLPGWLVFLATVGFAKGLVALGLILLMRGGLVSFGQGLFYCAGAYAAGLTMRYGGIGDAGALVVAGVVVALALAIIIAPLIAGYRGIFFATLTLALSMIAYGILNKTYVLGGSDGINLRSPIFFGYQPSSASTANYALFLFTSAIAIATAALARRHFDSMRGLLPLAIRDNEIRAEYLGASPRHVTVVNFLTAAGLGGAGGALAAMALGHIDPEFAFWTTSGEFVFLAILSGHASVVAVFLASLLLELVRSFSSQYFPNSWQMALGIFLLLVILLLPQGLGSLLQRRRKSRELSMPLRAEAPP